ncbi:hypothetical protein ACEN2I_19515 [Flavobacterium sp. W22_SRS_FK3]|uniref:hypothetical protein n=1 Tax=Flavobacterium sp. W22_SRS_FK3 TaxID=3240275 RepID=UPI003F8E9CCF
MKKIIGLFVLLITISCSNEDQVESNSSPASNLSSSVLDGRMLSFKDDESFIKEYSELSEMKNSKDIQNWISKKGHLSLLNSFDESNVDQDDLFNTSKIIYSDGIKAILNSDSMLKIGDKVIWLYEEKFYKLNAEDYDKKVEELRLIKDELEVYGTIYNGNKSEKTQTSRTVIPVINGETRSYSSESSGKRYGLILFIETIGVGGAQSSKVFLKSIEDYRSCSFWRCTWKSDNAASRVLNFNLSSECTWVLAVQSGVGVSVIGSQTILLASRNGSGIPCLETDFVLNGTISTLGANGYIWNQTF